MKKIKKLLAMIMAMTMVLGMAMTVSAAPSIVSGSDFESTITVIGLSQDVDTTVNMYRFATLQYDVDTNEYSWNIADWAVDYLNIDGAEISVKEGMSSDLKQAAMNSGDPIYTNTTKETSIKFENVLIGGYVIVPRDEKASYDPLFVTNTYNRDNSPSEDGKPVAEDKTVYAKSEDHTITKSQNDNFVQIGEKVSYTVKTTFPMMEDTDGHILNEFVITDTPVGIKIDESTVVTKIGGTEVDPTVSVDDSTGVLTIDFRDLLSNDYVGKDIEITYDAIVTDSAYNNSVRGESSTTDYDNGEVSGLNGSIELTKKDAETEKILKGAEFVVYDLKDQILENVELSDYEPMEFVFDSSKNAYRPALEGEESSSTVVATEGTLTIFGLDEGNYYFQETKAPNGYSINEELLRAAVTAPAEGVDTVDLVKVTFVDTKLASLPSTGGIGTTIFTIGGCAIMIAAAALYFVNRRKSEEN